MQRSITIGTAGHIDHGKTALVRALTGIDTDRLPQEKARGITIDLGFAHLTLGGTKIGIVDVPGHERFIKNMLAGAAGIEAALLVVAADDSVMPQTREHLAILDMLGVRRGVIAITKCDLAKPDWLDLVEAELRELVDTTTLEGATIVRTSSATGDGVDALMAELGRLIAGIEDEARREPFRMPIDRCFVVEGRGTVVTGTVWSGSVSVDDEVELLAAQQRVRIRGLQTHANDAKRLGHGERAAINLAGVHHSEIERGCELATTGLLRPSRRLTVDLQLLGEVPWALRPRTRVRLHLGTKEVMASVRLLEGARLEPGQSMLVQLICAEPVVAVCRQPLVIRSESPLVTIGGGAVLQPRAPLIRSGQSDAIDRLRALDSGDPAVRADAALSFDGDLDDLGLLREAAIELGEAERTIGELSRQGRVIDLGAGGVVHADRLGAIGMRIEGWLGQYHGDHPLQPGAAGLTIASQMGDIERESLNAATERLIDSGRVIKRGELLSLASFEPALDQEKLALLERVRSAYQEAGFRPPDVGVLAQDLRESERVLRGLLDVMVAMGEVIHLGAGLYMGAGAERAMRQRVEGHLGASGEMTMSELRTLLDTTRKYAVPLGEYLDRAGVTRRKGDVRVLVKPIRAPAG